MALIEFGRGLDEMGSLLGDFVRSGADRSRAGPDLDATRAVFFRSRDI